MIKIFQNWHGLGADQSERTLGINNLGGHYSSACRLKMSPNNSIVQGKGRFGKVGWIVQAHSWQMVVQGLQVMSIWLNTIMSFCYLAGSYLPEVLIGPCLGGPWSVFHHIHNLITVPAMEKVGLVSNSIWPLTPLWLDPDLGAGVFLDTLFESVAGFLNPGLSQKIYLGFRGPLPPFINSVYVRWVPLLLMVQITHLSSPISGFGLSPDHPPSSIVFWVLHFQATSFLWVTSSAANAFLHQLFPLPQ